MTNDIDNRIFFRLFQVANGLQKQAQKELGVSTVQWAVLGALSRPQVAEGMSLGHLVTYLVVSRQNLSGVLKRLERSGLVERAPYGTDRRARLVRLTAEGHRFWQALSARIGKFYEQATQGLSFDDRVSLLHYLNHLQVTLSNVSIDKD